MQGQPPGGAELVVNNHSVCQGENWRLRMETEQANGVANLMPGEYDIALIGVVEFVRSLYTGELKLSPVSLGDFALLTELLVLHDHVCSIDGYFSRENDLGLRLFDVSTDVPFAFGILPTIEFTLPTGESGEAPLLIREPGPPVDLSEEIKSRLQGFYRFDFGHEMRVGGFTDMAIFLQHVQYCDKKGHEDMVRVTDEAISAMIEVAPSFADQTALSSALAPSRFRLREFRSLGPEFYKIVRERHEKAVDLLSRYDDSYKISVPPLLAILLERCRSKDDIPEQLQILRNEFSDLRGEISKLEKEIRSGKSLGEQLEAIEIIERTREHLTAKIAGKKKSNNNNYKTDMGQIGEDGNL